MPPNYKSIKGCADVGMPPNCKSIKSCADVGKPPNCESINVCAEGMTARGECLRGRNVCAVAACSGVGYLLGYASLRGVNVSLYAQYGIDWWYGIYL